MSDHAMPQLNRYRRMHLDDMRDEADIRKDLEAVEIEMLARSPESRKLAQVCTERLAALASGWQPSIDEFAWISARIKAVWAAHPDLQARKDDLYDEFLARCEHATLRARCSRGRRCTVKDNEPSKEIP
jgi:hypothetical protein